MRRKKETEYFSKEDKTLGFRSPLHLSLALRLRQFTSVSLGLDFFIDKVWGGGGWWRANTRLSEFLSNEIRLG